MYNYQQLKVFAKQEVCSNLDRAVLISSSSHEGMFLSDRLEPWVGLARPIQHNNMTWIYYWPDLLI